MINDWIHPTSRIDPEKPMTLRHWVVSFLGIAYVVVLAWLVWRYK